MSTLPEDAVCPAANAEIEPENAEIKPENADPEVKTEPEDMPEMLTSEDDLDLDDDFLDDKSMVIPDAGDNVDSGGPTVRQLILAAIGVMKTRKARPDTKRICNWIHRRFGKPYRSISDELEKLVLSGELSRVDYKGSVSFRINTANNSASADATNGKGKRKKRETVRKKKDKVNSNIAVPSFSSSALLPVDPSLPEGVTQQVSLRTLVNDLIGSEPGGTNLPPVTATVTKKCIIRAIDSSKRNIDRSLVLHNLDYLLAREVDAGHFVRVGQDTFSVPPMQTLPPIIVHPTPPPATLAPFCPPLNSATPLATPTEASSTYLPSTTSPTYISSPPTTSPASLLIPKHQKTDEERKNDLIQEKLFKLSSSKSDCSVIKEPFYVTMKEKRLACLARKREIDKKGKKVKANEVEKIKEEKMSQDFEAKKQKRREEWRMTPEMAQQRRISANELAHTPAQQRRISANELAQQRRISANELAHTPAQQETTANKKNTSLARSGSKREEKSRKIFDPADHDHPVRKRKPTDTANPDESDMSVHSPEPMTNGDGLPTVEMVEEVVCGYCKKGDKHEMILTCKDCGTKVHPTCLDYSLELTARILPSAWQCTNCKTCAVCAEANPDEDEQMLFCDSCDLGYHMSCHRPKVEVKPGGKWVCFRCKPKKQAKLNGNSVLSKLVPLLPPHLHPHTGSLPANWEEFPVDPDIPDVRNWQASQVVNYFVRQGIQQEHAVVFLREEIDGNSLLLLNRQDVISNLGLKLGPAIKIFRHVRRLQTRKAF